MKISKAILAKFDGQNIKATVFNMNCLEDIDDIRNHLTAKYGAAFTETNQAFIVEGKAHIKPWLPRERLGVFAISGEQYFITTDTAQYTGRLKPRRTFFPVRTLSVKDDRTLMATIDAAKNYFIEYTLV